MRNNNFAVADPTGWHGTTILCVRRDGHVAMAGDGQVSLGQTIIKGNARKVRRIGSGGTVLAGFAGATADAFTLLERLESKLERFPNQLERACVELAKDWRTDRYLRRLEALMAGGGLSAEEIPRRAMKIAADICVYTNGNVIVESI